VFIYEQIVLLFLKAMCFHPEHCFSSQPLLTLSLKIKFKKNNPDMQGQVDNGFIHFGKSLPNS